MANFNVQSMLIVSDRGCSVSSSKPFEVSHLAKEFSKLSNQDNFPKASPSFGPDVTIKKPIFVTTPDGVLHVKVGEKHIPEITMENFGMCK
jgi:hypothetical protein